MKIEVPIQEFGQALTTVSGTLGINSPLEILKHYFLRFDENSTTISSNDGTTSTKFTIYYGSKDGTGEIILPDKMLKMVRALKGDTMTLEVDSEKLSAEIKAGSSKFKLRGLDPQEFPNEIMAEPEKSFRVDGEKLKTAIDKVLFAVSKDEVSYVFQNVNFNGSAFMSSDTFRAAIAEFTELEEHFEKDSAMLIPPKPLRNMLRALSSHITVSWNDNAIRFADSICEITTKLVDMKFPDISGVMPKSHELAIEELPVEEFLDALKRAALITDAGGRENKRPVKLHIAKTESGSTIELSAISQIAEFLDEVPVEFEGEEQTNMFQVNFLTEVLKYVPTEEKVRMEFNGEGGPGVIKWSGFYYLVLPIKKVNQ